MRRVEKTASLAPAISSYILPLSIQLISFAEIALS